MDLHGLCAGYKATYVPDIRRPAPSLFISYSTKSDIHGIIMNPQMGGDITVRDEILLSVPHSGEKVI